MANVPRVTRRVYTEALPGVRRRAAETEASAGVGIAQAEGQAAAAIGNFGRALGAVGGVVSEIAAKEREKAEDSQLLELDNQLSAFEAKAVYDPETGALTKKGKDAMGLPEAVNADYNKAADALASTITSDRVRQGFAQMRLKREANLEMTLRRHTFTEMQRYQVGEFEAFVSNKRDSAIANALDPHRVNDDVAAGVDAIRKQGPRLGMSPEQLAGQVDAFRSQAYSGVIDRLLAQDQTAAARAYFTETKDQIKGEALARIEKALEASSVRDQAQDQTEQILTAHPGDLAAQRAAAKKIDDRKVRDETLQRLEHEWAVKERQEAEEHKQLTQDVKTIIDQTGNLAKIPAPMWSKLTLAEASAVRNYALDRTRNYPRQSDPQAFYTLMQRATADDPAERAKFFDPKETNLLTYIDKLSESDWQQIAQMQTVGAANLKKEQHALLINQANQNRMVDEALVGMGKDPRPVDDPNGKKFSPEDIRFVNDFRRQVRDRVQALEQSRAGQGKMATATDDEVQGIVDRMRIEIGTKNIVVNFGRDKTRPLYAWEVTRFEDIPRDVVEAIKKSFFDEGKPAPAAAILRRYQLGLSGLK